jgi:aconitate hydratase
MSFWSDIEACARYLFRRIDPDFHSRITEWGGGIIVGGHNYGQGSSREQAALAPLHLGVPMVVAASFARIHRRNLIAQGIVPMLFVDDAERGRVGVGDRWQVDGVREAVLSGGEELTAHVDDGEQVRLRLELSAGERNTLAAGGLLRQLLGQA